MTAHLRAVNSSDIQYNGYTLVEVPTGFEIPHTNDTDFVDAISVCEAHPWQSKFLIFADGYICSTSITALPGNFYLPYH
jgi:hypothetical protein